MVVDAVGGSRQLVAQPRHCFGVFAFVYLLDESVYGVQQFVHQFGACDVGRRALFLPAVFGHPFVNRHGRYPDLFRDNLLCLPLHEKQACILSFVFEFLFRCHS